MEVDGERINAAVSSPKANLDISSRIDLMIADQYSLSVTVTLTVDNSLHFTRSWPRNEWTSPPHGQHSSVNVVSMSASAYWLLTLNSHLTLAVVRDFRWTAVESGRCWERRYWVTFSSWSQATPALNSSGVGFEASAGTGHEAVPLKWPHFWLASMASWKRMEKITQLELLVSRWGMEVGRGLRL